MLCPLYGGISARYSVKGTRLFGVTSVMWSVEVIENSCYQVYLLRWSLYRNGLLPAVWDVRWSCCHRHGTYVYLHV